MAIARASLILICTYSRKDPARAAARQFWPRGISRRREQAGVTRVNGFNVQFDRRP
jgi:hypothetical protein